MITIPGRIPINIHPFFWLLAGLIGWFQSGSLLGMLIWMGIIFVSILVHELGHALTALGFGKNPRIDLVALGGLTSYEPSHLSFFRQFIIVFNGPLAGFFLAIGAMLILMTGYFTNPLIVGILTIFRNVNFFWTIVNLIPILPLDGGQLLRIVLEAAFGTKGFKVSLFIGMLIAALLACFFFIIRYFLLGAIFFLFAFQSFDSWRKTRDMSDTDRKDDNKKRMMDGETALLEGRKDDAKRIFEEIRAHSDKGMIFNMATQYLALLYFEEGRKKESYELLLPLKKKISEQALCILHELAFEEGNFPLVAEFSSSCYQFAPSQNTALRNAKAFAALNNARHAGGWLQTANHFGKLNIDSILSESVFQNIKNNPEFLQFVEKLK